MRRYKLPSFVASAVVLTVAVLLSALILIPDSHTAKLREIEGLARDWEPQTIIPPGIVLLITSGIDLEGTWINRSGRTETAITISGHASSYEVHFSTGGCLGDCEFNRRAMEADGLIRLDAAVAEHDMRAYDALFAIHIEDADYLVPAVSVDAFERRLESGSDDWTTLVFQRGDLAHQQSDSL